MCCKYYLTLSDTMGQSSSTSDQRTVTQYYYTNEAGKDAILKSSYIKKYGDAVLDDGVYLTSLSPYDNSRKAIAQNNWKMPLRIVKEKTHYVFEVQIPESKLKRNNQDGRDIFLFFCLEDLKLWLLEDWKLIDWTSDKPVVIKSGTFLVV